MNNLERSSSTSLRNTWSPRAVACMMMGKEEARLSPDNFAAWCFTDPGGRSLGQATLHRELQAFLGQQRRALVELPRDHGKSVQVCIRILWELGHDPSLRVKIVCASDELAAERCRFLRDHIASNALLRNVFPDLRPALPWGTTRFTI